MNEITRLHQKNEDFFQRINELELSLRKNQSNFLASMNKYSGQVRNIFFKKRLNSRKASLLVIRESLSLKFCKFLYRAKFSSRERFSLKVGLVSGSNTFHNVSEVCNDENFRQLYRVKRRIDTLLLGNYSTTEFTTIIIIIIIIIVVVVNNFEVWVGTRRQYFGSTINIHTYWFIDFKDSCLRDIFCRLTIFVFQ